MRTLILTWEGKRDNATRKGITKTKIERRSIQVK
jgi:hypothetical protein